MDYLELLVAPTRLTSVIAFEDITCLGLVRSQVLIRIELVEVLGSVSLAAAIALFGQCRHIHLSKLVVQILLF